MFDDELSGEQLVLLKPIQLRRYFLSPLKHDSTPPSWKGKFSFDYEDEKIKFLVGAKGEVSIARIKEFIHRSSGWIAGALIGASLLLGSGSFIQSNRDHPLLDKIKQEPSDHVIGR